MNYSVSALAVSGSDLYTASGSSVAKWNGSRWSASGWGRTDAGKGWGVSGSDVYVGGKFTTAGANPANYIAKWNGSSWSALGSGIRGGTYVAVDALEVMGSDLYA